MVVAPSHYRPWAEKVQEILDVKERTKDWLARKMGISSAFLTLLMKGERRLRPVHRRLMAMALEVPEKLIFDEETDGPEPGDPAQGGILA